MNDLKDARRAVVSACIKNRRAILGAAQQDERDPMTNERIEGKVSGLREILTAIDALEVSLLESK